MYSGSNIVFSQLLSTASTGHRTAGDKKGGGTLQMGGSPKKSFGMHAERAINIIATPPYVWVWSRLPHQ